MYKNVVVTSEMMWEYFQA